MSSKKEIVETIFGYGEIVDLLLNSDQSVDEAQTYYDQISKFLDN